METIVIINIQADGKYMAMGMGNIELMVKLQVFTYIHDQRAVPDSSHQLHNSLVD